MLRMSAEPETSSIPKEPKNLGDRLRWLRKQRGITQVDLSHDLGCEQAVISSWEVGRTRPSAVTLAAIARYYRISVQSILTGDGFRLEATWSRRLVDTEVTAGEETPFNLPAHRGSNLMVVDLTSGSQEDVDHPEGMAVLIRALKKGRKVRVVLD